MRNLFIGVCLVTIVTAPAAGDQDRSGTIELEAQLGTGAQGNVPPWESRTDTDSDPTLGIGFAYHLHRVHRVDLQIQILSDRQAGAYWRYGLNYRLNFRPTKLTVPYVGTGFGYQSVGRENDGGHPYGAYFIGIKRYVGRRGGLYLEIKRSVMSERDLSGQDVIGNWYETNLGISVTLR